MNPSQIHHAGLILILGSPNDSSGNLSEMGQGRVTLGYETYLRLQGEGYRLLLTGGYGEHFNTTDKPNAFYARELLLSYGVPPDHIVEFAESRNTVDDALQSRPIIERYVTHKLIVVSSDFHLDRVRFIFGRVFPDRKLGFLGAPYLAGCSPERQRRLIDHETRELLNLQTHGESIVGGALNVDSWRALPKGIEV